VSEQNFKELTVRVKKLVREKNYTITYHVLKDHPEREILEVDILECLKIGDIASLEPREVCGEEKYIGPNRYRWFGQDTKDRVLRLIIAIKENVIIISAAEATENQRDWYLEEDKLGIIEKEEK
jgi:hypothetical protein